MNPHGPFKPCGFSYRLRLSPPQRDPLQGSRQVCGLDYPFTVLRKIRRLGAARLVSTPSRLMCVRAWLGIAVQGFPEFEQFCIAGFPASTQVLLKSAAYAIPPRPRAATSLMIGHLARFYTSFPGQPVPLEWPVFTLRQVSFSGFLFFACVTLMAAASSQFLTWES